MQGLSPGVQDAEKSELRTEMFGIGSHFEQGGRRGLEEKGEQDLLVLSDQRHERVWRAEDEVEIAPAGVPAAAGAATSPAHWSGTSDNAGAGTNYRRWPDSRSAGIGRGAPECSRPAAHDGRQHFDLRPRQRWSIAFEKLASGFADNIGHLPGWPHHVSGHSLRGITP